MYCFKCPACGYTVETTVRDPAPVCLQENDEHFWNDPVVMIRDYRAEAVGIETFTSVLGEGKVETRVVEPGDDITPRR